MKKIIILCGPSTSGKNTIIDSLHKESNYNFLPVVTNTTRPRRPSEVNGQIYNFLSKAEFSNKIEQGFFYEYENVHGNLYGTDKNSFLKDGVYLMQSDVRGALNMKKAFSDSLLIFINIPKDQIRSRLQNRGADSSEITERLKTADLEHSYMSKFDLVVDNSNGLLDIALIKVRKAIDNFLKVR